MNRIKAKKNVVKAFLCQFLLSIFTAPIHFDDAQTKEIYHVIRVH